MKQVVENTLEVRHGARGKIIAENNFFEEDIWNLTSQVSHLLDNVVTQN